MILVAGGTGFVGGGIVRELVRRGKQVAVLTHAPSRRLERFRGLAVELREGDVREATTLPAAMSGVTAVVASQTFPNLPIEDVARGNTFEEIDAKGTERLVAAAKAAGAGQFVYISGAGAAPDAEYPWHRCKWRAETAVRESGLTYTILRPSWVYGPGDRALNRFLGMSRLLPFVPLIGNPGKQRLQPVFVDDVARVAAESLENPAAANQTFEVGGPDVLTMREITRIALEAAGRRRFQLSAPKGLMKAMAAGFQYLPGRPLTPGAVDFITMEALADPGEVERVLGVKMTPLREGLATYLGKH